MARAERFEYSINADIPELVSLFEQMNEVQEQTFHWHLDKIRTDEKFDPKVAHQLGEGFFREYQNLLALTQVSNMLDIAIEEGEVPTQTPQIIRWVNLVEHGETKPYHTFDFEQNTVTLFGRVTIEPNCHLRTVVPQAETVTLEANEDGFRFFVEPGVDKDSSNIKYVGNLYANSTKGDDFYQPLVEEDRINLAFIVARVERGVVQGTTVPVWLSVAASEHFDHIERVGFENSPINHELMYNSNLLELSDEELHEMETLRDGEIGEEYHRLFGSFLGYPETAIDWFVDMIDADDRNPLRLKQEQYLELRNGEADVEQLRLERWVLSHRYSFTEDHREQARADGKELEQLAKELDSKYDAGFVEALQPTIADEPDSVNTFFEFPKNRLYEQDFYEPFTSSCYSVFPLDNLLFKKAFED